MLTVRLLKRQRLILEVRGGSSTPYILSRVFGHNFQTFHFPLLKVGSLKVESLKVLAVRLLKCQRLILEVRGGSSTPYLLSRVFGHNFQTFHFPLPTFYFPLSTFNFQLSTVKLSTFHFRKFKVTLLSESRKLKKLYFCTVSGLSART